MFILSVVTVDGFLMYKMYCAALLYPEKNCNPRICVVPLRVGLGVSTTNDYKIGVKM